MATTKAYALQHVTAFTFKDPHCISDFVPHPCNVINDVSHTISNAHDKHVFSVMKNLWTDERNRLRQREG